MIPSRKIKYHKPLIASFSRPFSGSSRWIQRHVTDSYVKRASELDLRSRSSFKLKEIQDKHKFIQPKDFVLDLGMIVSLHIVKFVTKHI